MFSISSVSIYYGTQSDIGVKISCGLHLLRASVFNFEHLDIFRDAIGHPSKNLLSFEFVKSLCSEFRASRYTSGLNRISELKVIVVCICYELLFSITGVSIYYGTQSNIRVKIYCLLNFQRAFVFNYERLDLLWDSIGHLSKNLLSFEFAISFCFQFRASRYITGFIWTSELKVIVVWICLSFCFQFRASRYITGLNQVLELLVLVVCICYELLFSFSSISIYYGTQSNIRVKIYCRLNLLRAFVLNFDRSDILRDSIGHTSK